MSNVIAAVKHYGSYRRSKNDCCDNLHLCMFIQSSMTEGIVNEEFLHRMPYAAKDPGETVWVENPNAVVQLLVWTERGIGEAFVGYNGEKITAHIGHEELESPETFLRLRSEIDDVGDKIGGSDPMKK